MHSVRMKKNGEFVKNIIMEALLKETEDRTCMDYQRQAWETATKRDMMENQCY